MVRKFLVRYEQIILCVEEEEIYICGWSKNRWIFAFWSFSGEETVVRVLSGLPP